VYRNDPNGGVPMMWSWALAFIGIAGIFLVGRKIIWGWIVLCINEVFWIVYAIDTNQYGFIFAAIAYGIVYIKSLLHWQKDRKDV
jgi:hypothetical protein